MDALCGVLADPTSRGDQALTTFITPYGRYRYRRSPMGFSASGDAYCRREKFIIASPAVSFCGYTLSEDGIAADKEKVRAISEFPKPANLTDLRSFIGLTNQLTDFSPNLAAAADPLRPLMSPKRSFTWTADHDAAFASV
ncbi:uncharacterized protein LOC135205201 [Macrobrachium nipponense]|uniref:uncharacterized protein LOC135205201 n=1 Tax=Macrobrachium nipponense TaxID=159736 RepID=UPI0030C88224